MGILDEQFKNWSEWFSGLSDEVGHLLISRETLKQVADFFGEKGDSYDAVTLDWFRKWIGSMWGVATAARLRALGDPDPDTKSLRCLLDKVKRHPEVFTRERYVALTGASDPYTMERANREFSENFGVGSAIDPERVEADIASMDAAVAAVKPYVDKRIAHLDPKWREIRLQFGAVYAALDVLRDLVKKDTLLFTGQFPPGHFGVLVQFDVRKILEQGREN
jgi:hypothetical protein